MKTCFSRCFITVVAFLTGLCPFVFSSEIQLRTARLPENGLFLKTLDFAAALHWSDIDPEKITGRQLQCELRYEGNIIPTQLTLEGTKGCLIALFPETLAKQSQQNSLLCDLTFRIKEDTAAPDEQGQIVTETDIYRITQSSEKQGGLPSRIEFKKTGRVLDTHAWHDRLYHVDRQMDVVGSHVTLKCVSDGPICKIVRQEIKLHEAGKEPSQSALKIVYHWFFFKNFPGLIHVNVDYFQSEPFSWKEKHALEFHIPDGSFGEFFTFSQAAKIEKFVGNQKSYHAPGAALSDGENLIAMFGSGEIVVYDGLNTGFGPYILGNGQRAWTAWSDSHSYESLWLLLDSTGENSPESIVKFCSTFDRKPQAAISIASLDASVENWTDVARNALFYSGVLKSKKELEEFKPDTTMPDERRFCTIQSQNLGMMLEENRRADKNSGIRLVALVDIPTLTLLTPPQPQSLFTVKLRENKPNAEDGKPSYTLKELTSNHGWKSIGVSRLENTVQTLSEKSAVQEIRLHFQGAANLENGDSVVLALNINSRQTSQFSDSPSSSPWYANSSIEMSWGSGTTLPDNLTLQSATLPNIRLASFGNRMKAFYPQASGIVLDQPFDRDLAWRDRYPSGWSTMPWFTLWNDADQPGGGIGLYVAAHDRNGTTKEQEFRIDSTNSTAMVTLEYPAENLGKPEAQFASCRVVLESFRGDWYNAAIMYRDWMRRESSWYPREKLGDEGRTDTPQWMKELCVWAIGGDLPQDMPEVLRKFQKPLAIPTAVHWYNWHKIPFDNDYPHYFPTKDGFKAAVAEIQKDGDLFVMPYINGRLWDTKDMGNEDWLFTKEALPGVTKQEDGSPYVETYESVETDGTKVHLGVMCPQSAVWNAKQREIIGRLTRPADGQKNDDGDMGVKGVYVDQVAAAAPALCFDETHGHPLAGGDWWVLAYRKMFETIRSDLSEGAILTTECNAEPFIDIFDGYLTWHFQHNGQVPAFAAVYGGAVQMFGRSYGGGPDHTIASRMKIAESFVFGEQIGWISPHTVNEPAIYNFLKKTVALRYKFRDYFYKGEMVRPPKFLGEMPKITADWHFCGQETIVTLGVLQSGAWSQPARKSVILLFANFSDQPQENELQVFLKEWGCDAKSISVVRHNSDGSEEKLPAIPAKIRLEPQEAFVIELYQ